MKILVYGMIAVISFVAALAGALALTGNLSRETLDRLSGKEAPVVAPPPQQTASDPLSPLVQQLKNKEETLRKRELELNERATQIDKRAQELDRLRTEIEGLQKQLQGAVQEADKERTARLQSIAITIAEMKPDKAAERLQGMPPDDIAEILTCMKPKERGKIVEALETSLATRVLRALQERKI
jgi:flagellar motility protein MotE (MotC chaperone)